ncbi:DUF4405 domain-containing protein [Pelosinus sp. sgz500959]|uniref:DUF4405 domain-containing protein n=1 Tax=Pelosinus sp. sgz500959 TaxID=3242472 RepID=UPI00366FDFF7
MFSKVEKNYLINIMLVSISLVCVLTGIGLSIKPAFLMPILISIKFKSLHEWTGYILTILMIWHVVMHSDWIKSMTKNMLSSKKKLIATVLTGLIALGICVSISTMLPDSKMPSGKEVKQPYTKNL